MIVGELKGLLSFKIKSRHDGYSDQFNRIFIVKILLVCSLVMGISWYKDSIRCVTPGVDGDFVSDACWIQGVYVFKELMDRIDEVAFYGMPKDINYDGMLVESGYLCKTTDPLNRARGLHCRPLTKTFFLQYQWFPFFIAALTILYYLPYVLHLYGNPDLISLKKKLKSGEADTEVFLRTYFNHKVNPVRQLRTRILFTYVVKLLYIGANVVSFVATDSALLGKFKGYGPKWVRWSKLDNHLAHDYMGMRDFPKPGNELLPPFGYCQVYVATKDKVTSMGNKHTFVCEMSQNILYQYCLILLWFVFVFGMIISIVGFLAQLLDHLITIMCVLRHGTVAKRMYEILTLRECEYLEFIRRRDLQLYSQLIQKLRQEKYHMELANGNGGLPDSPPPGFDELTRL